MFEKLEARVRARAERAAERVVATLAEKIVVPGVQVVRDGAGLVLSGKRLVRRAVTDPALRWLAGLLR